MSKREDLLKKLQPILNNQRELEIFLVQNSNLPGPRSNLELAFIFSEVFNNLDVLLEWLNITPDQADVNDPKSFLAFCSAVCLGKIYVKTKEQKLVEILKGLASDERWRMREAVAFAFQFIGENNFEDLKVIFAKWITKSNNLEKRAILASLAHPKFLTNEASQFCFEISEIILREMDTANNFEVLQKGLSYSLSVFVAANPDIGFPFMKRWVGENNLIDKIIKENLKKNRLAKKYGEEVKSILNYIESN